MNRSDAVKSLVKEKYGEIAEQSKQQNASSCCGSGGCCSDVDYTIFSQSYSELDGYVPEADLGLGCGIPTAFAQIRGGQTVVDLGSGAGNDVFVARRLVGETGRVIGLDMTDAMIEKAQANNAKLGFTNVEFLLGDIEQMPLADNLADVVISNCVLNLVPDKKRAFSEIFRILKPGGNFSISDVVIKGSLPQGLVSAAEMYVGCVAGALQRDEYLSIISKSGFESVSVVKETAVTIPDEILSRYLEPDELQLFTSNDSAIQSITVYGHKPGA